MEIIIKILISYKKNVHEETKQHFEAGLIKLGSKKWSNENERY